MVWVVIVVVATALLAVLPAARRTSDQLGGRSLIEVYHPLMVLVVVLLLSLIVLPEDLGGYRESGYLKRLRATPARPGQLLVARAVVTVGIEVVAAVVIVTLPILSGATEPVAFVPVALAIAVTCVAMLGIGFLIASASPNRKVGMAAGLVLFVLFALAAGLWFPREQMPGWMATAADWSPAGPVATALESAFSGSMPNAEHLLLPLGWAALAVVLSLKLFRWE